MSIRRIKTDNRGEWRESVMNEPARDNYYKYAVEPSNLGPLVTKTWSEKIAIQIAEHKNPKSLNQNSACFLYFLRLNTVFQILIWKRDNMG